MPGFQSLLGFLHLFVLKPTGIGMPYTYSPSNAAAYFPLKHMEVKFFVYPCHMLVFIGKLSLSTLRRVPMYQGFSHF